MCVARIVAEGNTDEYKRDTRTAERVREIGMTFLIPSDI